MAQKISANFENPFLNKQSQMMSALGEEQISLKSQKEDNFFNRDEFVAMMFATFVKEKEAIIVYVNELVNFAAKSQDIDSSSFVHLHHDAHHGVKSMVDVQLTVNRISTIVGTKESSLLIARKISRSRQHPRPNFGCLGDPNHEIHAAVCAQEGVGIQLQRKR
jgi:hypothetical protein